MEFFRIVASEEDGLRQPFGYFREPESASMERHVFQTCVEILKSHPLLKLTSLEQDEEMLLTVSDNERLKTALIYRMARKKLLWKHAEFCLIAMEEFLNCAPFDVIRKKPLAYYTRRLQELARRAVFPPPDS